MVNNPDTIIADEPTGNVDIEMSEGIMELLLRVNKLGKTVIVVTHDLALIREYKKRVIQIENGKLFADKNGANFGIDDVKAASIEEKEDELEDLK